MSKNNKIYLIEEFSVFEPNTLSMIKIIIKIELQKIKKAESRFDGFETTNYIK
jgi:hypothetical protein